MKRNKPCLTYCCLWLSLLLVFFIGCAPAEVKVQLIGTRTSLESQVLGSYKQIGQEAWLISSVRGSSSSRDKLSPGKKEVFTAIENQEFNADDVIEFKDAGIVGEDNQGQLVIKEIPRVHQGSQYEKLIHEIISEENHDRLIIIRRIIMENPQLKQGDLSAVRKTFARIYWQKAAPHHWLLTEENRWLQKKDFSPKSLRHEK